MADFPHEHTKMTIKEYRNLPESAFKTELINGELIIYKGKDNMSPAPKDTHQRIFTALFLKLGELTHKLSGELRGAPTDVYVDDINAIQPDIFWVSSINILCKLKDDGYWYGAPDLVVEILSPATAIRDKTTKYDLYESNHVREYWIVDPHHYTIDVYILHEDIFTHQGIYSIENTFTSQALNNQAVDVKEIFS